MTLPNARLESAHRHATAHRADILASQVCGCFFCQSLFQPDDIGEWIDAAGGDGEGQTALCPHCGIDAVIGAASGLPVTAEFLADMHAYWFGTTAT